MKVYMSFVAAPEKWMADAYSCARNFLKISQPFECLCILLYNITIDFLLSVLMSQLLVDKFIFTIVRVFFRRCIVSICV